jgi:hypothetical protein
MEGIVKAMLLLILMGGLVIFLLMQVLGYGVPLPDAVGVSQAAGLPKEETPSTGQDKLARRTQRLDQREAQLDEREKQLDERAAALAETGQQQAGEAARLKAWADQLAQDQANLDAQEKQMDADREALGKEQAQVEGLRQAVVAEAARQTISAGELEAQRALAQAHEQELSELEQRLYVIAFVLCAVSIVYHLVILRLLWVRGYLVGR